jgi:hypothetical protein
MKKILKITSLTILIVFLLLLAIPFVFESQIKTMVKNFINENLNAKVEFRDVSLSLIRSFPEAHVKIDDLVITNFEPFKDETLATVKSLAFTMSVKELFKKADDEPIIVNSISVNEALLTLKTNQIGVSNYDITKSKNQTSDEKTSETNFSFDIKSYSITNSALSFIDEASNLLINISQLNHQGKGVFSGDKSELDTKSEAFVSIAQDDTKYLNNNSVKLDALIGLDLKNQIYTFKDNAGFINQLPLKFSGFVQLLEEGQKIDIAFENPGSSFKDFLAVFPENYTHNIETIETTGNFKVNGYLKGLISEETIPTIDINIISDNASFKFPDLPKRVENITINTSIKNETGKTEDTYIAINALNFKIDNDEFKSSALLKNIMDNMLVNADIDGTINLANITKAYPVNLDTALSGILKAKLNTVFDMNAIETNAYKRIKNSGSASITNFIFSTSAFKNPIHVSKADMIFNPSSVNLKSFNAKTGVSDISATGTITNLLGYLLSNNKLQGSFNVNSNTFNVSDFMVEKPTEGNNNSEDKNTSLNIPDFLDCTVNATANSVIYDNLNLKNVKGILLIKDQQVTLKELTSGIFDGILAITGYVSTKTETPVFNVNLGAEGFDLEKSFNDLELLQNLAPIVKVLQGKLNTIISINGNLNSSLSPNLNSLSGSAFAELITSKIKTNSPILNQLGSTLNFIEFDKLDLKDLKTNITFENGKVNVKPVSLKYKDIAIQVSGSHGFDKSLTYNAVFDVPAKYLGSEINQLLGKINDPQVNAISIPVTANITGSITNPIVKTDLSSGVTNLTKQLIEIEKQKLINKGSNEIKNLLDNIISNPTTNNKPNNSVDSTNTKPIDTTKAIIPVKDPIKDILGGLIKNRKKKDTIR